MPAIDGSIAIASGGRNQAARYERALGLRRRLGLSADLCARALRDVLPRCRVLVDLALARAVVAARRAVVLSGFGDAVALLLCVLRCERGCGGERAECENAGDGGLEG